ncbi:hypothetical protein H4Q32_028786 [Labeo rohita]|uniref:Uncharacterized protein n=1 Tax=Labeo rohita TaxID=84645 RepID=A0ABQ8KZI7_LABRO|nr:hypothetical protein H4Q32_028786 [Labeo rohita]
MTTVAYINHQSGLRSRRMLQSPPLESDVAQTAMCHSYGELNRAADALSRQLTRWFSSFGVDSGKPRILPLPVVLLPNRGSPRHGRTGTQLAPRIDQVCLSRSERPCTDSVQDPAGRGAGLVGYVLLAHPILVRGTHAPRDSPSLKDSPEEGLSLSGDGHHLAPRVPILWNLHVWLSGRDTKKLERRLSPSTLKVYVAAIAVYHDAVNDLPLGRHHLLIRFLRGARRLNPPRPHFILFWDLFIVLTGLRRDSFEPLESVELKFLSLKTSLLIALTSIKRVGDLHAFSVIESCLEFGPADSNVILRPQPGYVPKVPTSPFRDQVVNLQALPPRRQTRPLGCCVPFVHFAFTWTAPGALDAQSISLVALVENRKENAVSKQRLAHWVVDAITLALVSLCLGVRAHSTRSVASSWALAHGASLADVCTSLRRACFLPCFKIKSRSVHLSLLFPLVNSGSSMPSSSN